MTSDPTGQGSGQGAPGRGPHVDGNAAAGLLGELYAFDATLALVRCQGCGHVGKVAETVAYVSAMGTVLRCHGCAAVLVVLVERPDGPAVSAVGASWVRAPRSVPAG